MLYSQIHWDGRKHTVIQSLQPDVRWLDPQFENGAPTESFIVFKIHGFLSSLSSSGTYKLW